MARSHSITNPKPTKPNPPLFAHNNGQWAKKIKGKIISFGVWADPKAAVALYWQEREAWEAGRNPRQAVLPEADRITVGQMVALMLDAKESLVATGEIDPRTYEEYCRIGAAETGVGGQHPRGHPGPGRFRPPQGGLLSGP